MTNDPPNPYPNYTEQALIMLAKAGDDAAFDVLFERKREELLKVALGELGSLDEAAISVDQTYEHLRGLRRGDLFKDHEFWDWMSGITRIMAEYRARDLRRKAKRAASARPDAHALTPHEQLLLVLAKRGNRRAFDTLVEPQRGMLFVRTLERQPEPKKAWAYVDKLQDEAFRRLNETDPVHFRKWLAKLRLKRPVNNRPAL
jgi:hypothetical protein